jgi:hypothetical protein
VDVMRFCWLFVHWLVGLPTALLLHTSVPKKSCHVITSVDTMSRVAVSGLPSALSGHRAQSIHRRTSYLLMYGFLETSE